MAKFKIEKKPNSKFTEPNIRHLDEEENIKKYNSLQTIKKIIFKNTTIFIK